MLNISYNEPVKIRFEMPEQDLNNQQPVEQAQVEETASAGQVLLALIHSKLGQHITSTETSCGDAVVCLQRAGALDFFRILKLDSDLAFDFLVDVTVVDWLDSKEQRFSVVYHLMSIKFGYRLRVKIPLSEVDPEIDSLAELWHSANFLEREAWDMFGVKFTGHPDLRRVLMYDEFQGHPLRKDYPLQGKQPRIKLRSPEVSNTARQMLRHDLVQINSAKINSENRK